MGQQRQIWADSLKGILILLVVLGHAIQGVYTDNVENSRLWCIKYSFHMPAFFAISGYFVKYAGIRRQVYTSILKRVQQLLVPYFIWAILKLILIGEVNVSSLTSIITDPVSFWFLWVLFVVYLLFQFSLFLYVKSKRQFNYESMIMAVALIGMMAVFNTKLFGYHLISYYFAFYAIGYYMGQYRLLSIKSKLELGVFATIWFFMAWNWSMHELPSWMPVIPYIPSSIVQLAYRFITAFVAIILLQNIAPMLLVSTGKVNSVCAKLGFYSLGIYTTHYLIIWSIADGIVKLSKNSEVSVLMTVVIATVLSLALVWLLNINKYTSALFLGKINRA